MGRIKRWLHRLKMRLGLVQRGRTEGKSSTQFQGVLNLSTKMTARHLRMNPETGEYEEIDRRVVLDQVVTTAGVNFLVDAFQNVTEIENFKYHDSGTGTTPAVIGDTALETPCGIARATGSQTEGASANIYKTVGTQTYDGTYAVTEHGLFSAASAGTLWDRHVFSAINVVNTDQIEFTYELTCTAGG